MYNYSCVYEIMCICGLCYYYMYMKVNGCYYNYNYSSDDYNDLKQCYCSYHHHHHLYNSVVDDDTLHY